MLFRKIFFTSVDLPDWLAPAIIQQLGCLNFNIFFLSNCISLSFFPENKTVYPSRDDIINIYICQTTPFIWIFFPACDVFVYFLRKKEKHFSLFKKKKKKRKEKEEEYEGNFFS